MKSYFPVQLFDIYFFDKDLALLYHDHQYYTHINIPFNLCLLEDHLASFIKPSNIYVQFVSLYAKIGILNT